MRILFFLLIGLASYSALCQSEWISINTDYGGEYSELHEVIPVVDKASGNFAFFLKERKKALVAYLFDENQKLVSEFLVPEIPNKTNKFIGSTIKGNLCTLFFKGISGKRFSSMEFDFQTKEYQIKDLGISLKKEVIIDYFQDVDNFYMLSIIKGTSILKLYSFSLNSTIEVKTIDLSNETFVDFERGTFYNLYLGQFGSEKTTKINLGEPASLEMTSSENKSYFNDGQITLTTDFSDKYTYQLKIDIESGDYFIDTFQNKNINKDELRAKSNSFVFEDYFFQVYSTPKRLALDIYDRDSMSLVKELHIDEHNPILFKNTPIILEGGDFDKYRELERNKQFLRKVTKSNLGLAVYKQDDKYIITIGASEEFAQAQFVYLGGGFIGGAIGGALFAAFNSYSRTKSTRIGCQFDKNFNHVEGELPVNGFDMIKNFTRNFKNPAQHETIFKYKDYYIRGVFYKKSGVYRFAKFIIK